MKPEFILVTALISIFCLYDLVSPSPQQSNTGTVVYIFSREGVLIFLILLCELNPFKF